ncbi:hypothetical protein PV325_008419, partial [Microctonus aethiopoides]
MRQLTLALMQFGHCASLLCATATAFLNANLSHSQGDQILAALWTHLSLSLLPKVKNTLLHTPRQPLKPIPMGS